MAGGQGELHQVLEAATRALSSTSAYQDDPRYLRIWLQYVSWKEGCGWATAPGR